VKNNFESFTCFLLKRLTKAMEFTPKRATIARVTEKEVCKPKVEHKKQLFD